MFTSSIRRSSEISWLTANRPVLGNDIHITTNAMYFVFSGTDVLGASMYWAPFRPMTCIINISYPYKSLPRLFSRSRCRKEVFAHGLLPPCQLQARGLRWKGTFSGTHQDIYGFSSLCGASLGINSFYSNRLCLCSCRDISQAHRQWCSREVRLHPPLTQEWTLLVSVNDIWNHHRWIQKETIHCSFPTTWLTYVPSRYGLCLLLWRTIF